MTVEYFPLCIQLNLKREMHVNAKLSLRSFIVSKTLYQYHIMNVCIHS